jgi:2-haloacid dehalogenase
MTATAEPGPEPGAGPAGQQPGRWSGVRTLVFDVLGTVVDESGSIADQVTAALAAAGADPTGSPALAARWNDRVEALTSQTAAGQAPWRSNDELRRTALLEAVAAAPDGGVPGGGVPGGGVPGGGVPGGGVPGGGVPDGGVAGGGVPRGPGGAGFLSAAALEDLALAGHRLRPWPDSGPALRALAGSFTVVALSNASLAQLTDMFAAGGLAWHCVLSGELVRSYKPDPAVYQLAIGLLGLDPAATMMVAAHPWDLRAAAAHGLRTAYVARPGEGVPDPGDRFDIQVGDLTELAARLTGPG